MEGIEFNENIEESVLISEIENNPRRSERINIEELEQFSREYNHLNNMKADFLEDKPYTFDNIINSFDKCSSQKERNILLSLLIIKISEDVPKFHKVFKNVRMMEEQPAYSNILEAEIPNFEDVIIKYRKELGKYEYDTVFFHEVFVGLILNKMKKYVPNFVTTYGNFQAVISIEEDITFRQSLEMNDDCFLVIEKINNAVELSKFVENATISQYLQVLLQILNALNYANREFEFSHNDLHDDNILIETLKDPVYIPYYIGGKVKYIYTRFFARIIDFGLSFVKLKGEPYGFYGREPHRILSNRQNPILDSYKLICFTGNSCFNAGNSLLFAFISNLYEVFEEEITLTERIHNWRINNGIIEIIDGKEIESEKSDIPYCDGMNYGEFYLKKESKKLKANDYDNFVFKAKKHKNHFSNSKYSITENYGHEDLILHLEKYYLGEASFIKDTK